APANRPTSSPPTSRAVGSSRAATAASPRSTARTQASRRSRAGSPEHALRQPIQQPLTPQQGVLEAAAASSMVAPSTAAPAMRQAAVDGPCHRIRAREDFARAEKTRDLQAEAVQSESQLGQSLDEAHGDERVLSAADGAQSDQRQAAQVDARA